MITFRAAKKEDKNWAFDLRTDCECAYITRHFGWDTDFQHQLYNEEWRKTPPVIILYNGERAGFFCLEKEDEVTFLRKFFVSADFRNRGIGTAVVKRLQKMFAESPTGIRLAVFHGNPSASLYQRHGFILYKECSKYSYYCWNATNAKALSLNY
ncbi:GNAT family N-acetyltransferase [Veronia pacifica]|uniref:N-acetyltransferase domain-containing protein n=1 Tax=Veronia pacifica TaxID=1080227 RepID=A0A1C3EDI6_9GAMM|nr:GNAT family N-acetyltransferase [Veronia pacifica]ODA31298.1 hypothetical protein A8L45_17560 [Veronia pacifica]